MDYVVLYGSIGVAIIAALVCVVCFVRGLYILGVVNAILWAINIGNALWRYNLMKP